MQVEVLEAAALAIVEQADWYEQNGGKTLSDKWAASVDQAIERLVRWPEIGTIVRVRSVQGTGLRWAGVPGFPKHLIFYRYLLEGQLLQIVRVAHGARDLELLLAPHDKD